MSKRRQFAVVFLSAITTWVSAADAPQRFIDFKDNQLSYQATPQGDRIVDFSCCGFQAGGKLPAPQRAIEIGPAAGDCTQRLQRALDAATVAARATDALVSVQLLPGRYEVAGPLRLTGSKVVLRGAAGGKTTLVATGIERRAVISVGETVRKREPLAFQPRPILALAPAGTRRIQLETTEGLHVGDRVCIDHGGTKEWVHAVGMDQFPSRDLKGSWLDWKPGTIHLTWHRRIDALNGSEVTLDAPLTYALNPALAAVTLAADRRFQAEGTPPISVVGVEDLVIESTFDAGNPHDEEHAWDGIRIDQVEDGWVRNVTFRHLAGSAVAVWEHARRVTVCDCRSQSPVSEVGGHRRNTFFSAGEQVLFLGCTSESGRHDFSVGHLAAGPNAFVSCTSRGALGASGSIGSWACGILYDNVEVDGAGLALTNFETENQGTGWAAANSVLWNCVAPRVTCRMPPTAQNWAIGVWGEVVGDGHWRHLNEFASPESLFEQQLGERLGRDAARQVLSFLPADARHVEKVVPPTESDLSTSPSPAVTNPLGVHNGWLTLGGRLAIGGRFDPVWWRGSVLPTKASEFGPCLTRFVPGQEGEGFTDRVDDVVRFMLDHHQVALGHHWGLWYDRRRDDHQMVRRMDGNVWAPFYEQPWARSGKGTAWDGLSQYDLTKFNPWYFGRLKTFADQADRAGLVLLQQMYFQHNILEAGAHWADFPWRPANCLQDTGFPEPPVYENRKRIFMADAFYDVSHAGRRALHRAYIRHCLDVLGSNSNVVFLLGEEYTGPAHFMTFWLETIRDWQNERGRNVIVGLSATKDVQEQMLADQNLAGLIDVIDLKYWWYTSNGNVYAPDGGQNLAPRQQLREWKGNSRRTDAEVGRAIAEYRTRFPDKAVICSLPGSNPWVVMASGGSLPALPPLTSDDLRRDVPRMQPSRDLEGNPDPFTLATQDGRRLRLRKPQGDDAADQLPAASFSVAVDGKTGQIQSDAAPPGRAELKHYLIHNW